MIEDVWWRSLVVIGSNEFALTRLIKCCRDAECLDLTAIVVPEIRLDRNFEL